MDSPQHPPAAHVITARLAVTLIFFINGVTFSSWVARIPQVQSKLDISEGRLGLALLALAIGALLSLLVTGWLVARFGSKPVTFTAALVLCLLVPLPGLAPSWALLSVVLFAYGAANGSLDVAMNSQGVLIQHHIGKPILSSMHAAFSFGGFVGAALGGGAAALDISPAVHLTVVAIVAGGVMLFSGVRLLSAHEDAGGSGSAFVRPSRALAALGIIAFCGLITEGAVADWSAVYLRNSLDTSAGLAAGGFAAFSLTMAAGRLTGDRLVFLFNAVIVARTGAAIATAGMAIALLTGSPILTIVGFALAGAGLANVIPIVFSAAARMPGLAPGPAIAAVASTGYLGFLTGPPIIGFIAELATLRVALTLLVLALATIVVLAGRMR